MVTIDLQSFSEATRANAKQMLFELCAQVEYQLKLPPAIRAFWKAKWPRDPLLRATSYRATEVLSALDGRKLVVGLDECDTLLGRCGGSVLFPLLRSWVEQARRSLKNNWRFLNRRYGRRKTTR